jgi:membrane associated rhomboid family serine protease
VTDAAAQTTDDADAPPVCYRHPKRETYVTCQRCGRPICPECQIQAPVGVQCPECVREGRAAASGGANPLRRVARALRPSGTPVVTFALIGLCVVIYAVQYLSQDALTNAWLFDPRVTVSQPWRLLTSGFLHSTAFVLPIHLLVNMYALYAIGPVIESFLGRARFLVLYLVALLGGSIAEVVNYALILGTNGGITDATNGFIYAGQSLGASGAIFGLFGALLVGRKALGLDLRQLLILLVINLGISFFVPHIAWQAHLGGFGIGAAVMGVYLVTRRRDALVKQVVGVAAIVLGLAAILGVCVALAPGAYF